jgi:DHA1 family tetracycline resistance protein-like MFS transporter
MSAVSPLEYAAPPPPAPKSAMGILWLVVFADMMGFGLIVPSLPLYADHYGASPLQISLLFSLYSACQFLASPVLGALSDRYGRRPVLVFSQIGTASGYLLLGWTMLAQWSNVSVAIWLMYLSRIVDGISGGNISTAHAYIGDISTPQNRAARMGLLGAAFGLGFSAGPALGGLLSLWHPSGPAFAAAGFAAVACVLTIILLPESRRAGQAATSESFLHPSRFMPVLRNPLLGQLLFGGFFAMMAFVMLEVVFALYLQRVFSYGQTAVNWLFAMVGLVIMIVQAGLIGPLVRAFGEWRVNLAGTMIAVASMALYALTCWHPLVAILIPAALLNAFGRSMWFPSLNSLISHSAGRETQGITFGVFHAMMSLSRVIGPLIAGVIFARHVSAPFIVAGAILFGVGVWIARLHNRRSKLPAAQIAPTVLESAT